MSDRLRIGALLCAAFLLLGGLTFAQKKASTENNGFPSGPHYNLNIIGKKADFNCNNNPEPDPITGTFGSVVFVPETGQGQINLQSGSTKGKTASTFTGLDVPNPCAGFDGSTALVRLKPNEAGYRVYARTLAKPSDNEWTISLTPGLSWVQDEYADDLVYLGLVTSNGFQSAYQDVRIKGHSVAVPISDLFEWAGTVCYQFQPTDESGVLVSLDGFASRNMCWVDTNANGLYDQGDTISEATFDGVSYTCSEGIVSSLYCGDYDVDWVFNIADLVQYFWGVDTNGSKLVQIRFYPN